MAGAASPQGSRTYTAPAFGSQIAQLQPTTTGAETIYTCPASAVVEISLIYMCNPAGTNQLAYLYHDNDGASFGTATALIDGKVIPLDDYLQICMPRGAGIWMNRGGSIGVKTNLADSMTFTLYGVVYEIN